MAEEKKEDLAAPVRISVRSLVEFILRSGDIDNRTTSGADQEAMQLGSRLHRKIQGRMGSAYQAEVSLKTEFPCDDFQIRVEGRADGIFTETDDETGEERVVIDEIKGIFKDLALLNEPIPVHLAQAKCYAYMYALQEELAHIDVRMSYGHLETQEMKYFRFSYTFPELEEWFFSVLEEYKKWARWQKNWHKKRGDSIRQVRFPFTYREGQKQLAGDVYRTISRGKILFIEAPTGVGKTISTVFPSVMAVGQGLGDKIFYLTAKTIARTVAADAFDLLRQQGLAWKSVIVTAKEKICLCEKTECNPGACPYAKGHFDRINDAVYALITSKDAFTREVIEEAALRYRVCPFELSLDLTLWADSIIGDYNYVFHPRAKLRRFFGDGVKGDYLFLIDEAHNLVDRGRDMYSAVLYKESLLEVKKLVKGDGPRLARALERANKAMLQMKREHGGLSGLEVPAANKQGAKPAKSSDAKKLKTQISDAKTPEIQAAEAKLPEEVQTGRENLRELPGAQGMLLRKHIGTLPITLTGLYGVMQEYLDDPRCGQDLDVRQAVLDLYFDLGTFLETCDLLDEHYSIYTQLTEDGRFMLKLLCVDPSANLQACLDKARSSILFSATFLPIGYYKRLLSTREDNYAIYAKSCFDADRCRVLIGRDTSSRYTLRGPAQYERMAAYIAKTLESRPGNYLVFFPSYRMLEDVAQHCEPLLGGTVEMLLQTPGMQEEEREAFLAAFSPERTQPLVGFCVMGSIFGEGIDLKENRLIGTIIVGTGLPQVSPEIRLLQDHYDRQGLDGFRYAYQYPGMNRVLQAAGRVIRTEKDKGVVILLDDRFTRSEYKALFPREWSRTETVTLAKLPDSLKQFWESVD